MNMKLTKEKAIQLYRDMWNWIADETLKQKMKVEKINYFETMEIPEDERPICSCYACEYAKQQRLKNCDIYCDFCPIDWGNDYKCVSDNSLFMKFGKCDNSNYNEASKLAREIANLPEREV